MKCTLCPRKCGADRESNMTGVCGVPAEPVVARAGLHMWEEPVISGTRGAGTVFFSGCPLKCVFCQNYEISTGGFGKRITVGRLREIFHELIDAGAHNIDLVNPTHFTLPILQALEGEKLPVPVIWNSGGYESPESLRLLENKVDMFLPDMKYA
ncbi:MAG: 4Fe-4S cluster-binding domain-containing protein, partial [Oscillospiraceae bacterium]|nr:4Fe-4S cluster-binding domain-containing protein [Oscillospiraceae bacterium]